MSVFIFGCQSAQEFASENPSPLAFEFEAERIKSPITGEVPSHLRFEQLPEVMGENVRNKRKVYPNTWQPVDDKFANLNVTQVVADPQNSSLYYFCTGEGWVGSDVARGAGLWKSIDAGKSWTSLQSTKTPDFYLCNDMIVHPVTSDVYVATMTDGIMRSKDKGDTWEQVLASGLGSKSGAAGDLELTADNDIVCSFGFFSNNDGVYISSTGDANDWAPIVNGLPTSDFGRIEIATAPSNSEVLYAIPFRSSDRLIHGIYRTNDRGASWSKVTSPGDNDSMAARQGWYDLSLAVDPLDENIAVAGGLNVWRTLDGGSTWQQMFEGRKRRISPLQYAHVDQHNVYFINSDTLYLTNDGGIYRTDNFTADTPFFYDLNLNYNVTQYYSCDIAPQPDNNLVLGGTQDNGSHASTDDGISEFKQISWADGSFCAIDHENGEYLYTTTQFARIYRTFEGNADTITNSQIQHGQDGNTLFINPIHMDVNDPEILYQATNTGLWALFNARTSNKDDWKQVSNRFGTITAIATSRLVKNTAFVGRTYLPYRVENIATGDENNKAIPLDRNGELERGSTMSCIVPDDLDSNHLIIIYSNYDAISVYETNNAFDDDPDWTSCEGNLPNLPIRWGCFKNGSSDVFYVTSERGVYSTNNIDGENTVWEFNSDGLPNVRTDMIKSRISDNKFVLATYGRGIWTGIADANNRITWTERGPSNVGGRTRTLLFDPNDPTKRKVWAGSVSGGLWVVENIDSSAFYYEVASSTTLNVYPNPASSNLVLKFNEDDPSDVHVKIYNNLGQLVLQKTVQSAAEHNLDINGLVNGIIYVSVEQGEQKIVRKIIKTN
ncbi:MAG: T9SS type A sorting domain-containing protein [Bacteroidia bacterium]|nr:T9SS type A sorting domain-containing protein [Bacteroidia bacterium]NNJ55114.1 T9SS type A sorting domain-containing protein [Bacteroidia bacterium]